MKLPTLGRCRALALTFSLAAALSAGHERASEACAGSFDVLAESAAHPDLPLDAYVSGELGLVRPSFARSYLAVAYLTLGGAKLGPEARESLFAMYRRRLFLIDGEKVHASPSKPAPRAVDLWAAEQARVLARAPSPPDTSFYASYAVVEGCPEHAFTQAVATLREREARRPASPELRAWVEAQDKVFANCSRPAEPKIPDALPPSASAEARADRDYQIAAASFYAARFDDAERRFRALGAQGSSSWAALARYLVVRTMVRRATVGRESADAAELARALRESDAILADRALAVIHPMTARYREHVLARLDARRALDLVRARLEARPDAPSLGADLESYTLLLDGHEEWLASADPARDGLTAWIGVMQGKAKHGVDVALRMHSRTGGVAWLVAALVSATDASDRRLDPLLAEAARLPSSSPAFATARFHLWRIALARGTGRDLVYARVAADRQRLSPRVGRSTRNAFAALMRSSAPSLDAFLRESVVEPAGSSSDYGPVEPSAKVTPGLAPEVVSLLGAEAPLDVWRDATLSQALTEAQRIELAWATYVRALLLDDAAIASSVASLAKRRSRAAAAAIASVEAARGRDARALASLALLLELPAADAPAPPAALPAGGGSLAFDVRIDEGYAQVFLGAAPGEAPASLTPWASPKTRARVAAERAKIAALGPSPAYFAKEAVRLAGVLPDDPRVPKLLHLAVAGTRHQGDGGVISAASRAAFETLHKRYPTSPWARKTKYWY